jgi:hypothetical protein
MQKFNPFNLLGLLQREAGHGEQQGEQAAVQALKVYKRENFKEIVLFCIY